MGRFYGQLSIEERTMIQTQPGPGAVTRHAAYIGLFSYSLSQPLAIR
jgi:hypothetical protein